MVVEDAGFVRTLREFVASIDSDDERQVYHEHGQARPRRARRTGAADEASWWYFESGPVYRFRDGGLVQVIPFDPVKEF